MCSPSYLQNPCQQSRLLTATRRPKCTSPPVPNSQAMVFHLLRANRLRFRLLGKVCLRPLRKVRGGVYPVGRSLDHPQSEIAPCPDLFHRTNGLLAGIGTLRRGYRLRSSRRRPVVNRSGEKHRGDDQLSAAGAKSLEVSRIHCSPHVTQEASTSEEHRGQDRSCSLEDRRQVRAGCSAINDSWRPEIGLG